MCRDISSRNFNPTDNEQGAMTSICMLFCIAGIIAYIKVGRFMLTEAYSLEIHLMIVSLLAVVTLCTIGCQIHMIIKGEKSPGQIRRLLKRQLKELSIATTAALERLNLVEDTISWKSRTVRPMAYEHGARAQELISRLISRGRAVEELLRYRRKDAVCAAAELMSAPLCASDNCQETLIQARPLPELMPEQWIPTLEQLLQATEFEVDRAEGRIRSQEMAV